MPEPRAVSRPLGWVLALAGAGALVYFPAATTGIEPAGLRLFAADESVTVSWDDRPVPIGANPGSENVHRIAGAEAISGSTNLPAVLWEDLAVPGAFGVTTGLDVGAFYLLLGANPGTGNVYRIAGAEGIPYSIDQAGNVRLNVTATQPFTVSPAITALNGACCAAPVGVVSTNMITTVITLPGFNTQEVAIETEPPYATTFIDLGTGSHLSAVYTPATNVQVASTYDTTAGQVKIFKRALADGSYTAVQSVNCTSPFANAHWGQASDLEGSKTFPICLDGGPVKIRQIDLTTGAVDWTQIVDSLPAPTSFRYWEVDHAGAIRNPVGGTSPAIAYLSPGPTQIRIGMLAPVGLGPPTWHQFVDVPGTVADRQGLSADGPIVTVHAADPDGVGMILWVLNFGNLSSPPTLLAAEDDSRTPIFASIPEWEVWSSTNLPSRVIPDRTILVNGTATDISVFAAAAIITFQNFETGDTSQWDFAQEGPP